MFNNNIGGISSIEATSSAVGNKNKSEREIVTNKNPRKNIQPVEYQTRRLIRFHIFKDKERIIHRSYKNSCKIS